MRTDPHQPCHLALNIKVCMLAEKWEPGDLNVMVANRFHFSHLNHIFKAAILQEQLERWILKMAPQIPGDQNSFYLVPDLQKRFEQDVILVAVGDQDIVDCVR